MGNKKKIIICIIAGIVFILAFILNLLFPPKPFIKTAHAVEGSLDSVIQYFLDNPDVPLSDLVQDETHYNYLKDYASSRMGVDLPSWDSSGTNDDVYNFFRNIASGFIGQYAYPDQANLTSLIGSFNDLNDFLELINFDSETGEFIVSPVNGSGIIDRVNHTIYSPGNSTVGSWRLMPQTIFYPYYGRTYSLTTSDSEDVWVCIVREDYNNQNRWILWSSKDPNFVSTLGGYALNSQYASTYSANGNTYYWVLSSQMYSAGGLRWESSSGPECGVYSNHNSALSALWGSGEPSSDPSLTGAIIVNDDPNFTGISLPSAGFYDYSTTIVNNYIDDNDDPIPNRIFNYQPYTYTYTIPYDNTEYELPIYPEIPHDLPEVTFNYPEITANEEIQEGMNGLSSLWVTLLTMGGSFIVLKVIL